MKQRKRFVLALLGLGILMVASHSCGSSTTTNTLSTLDPSTGVFPNVANVMK